MLNGYTFDGPTLLIVDDTPLNLAVLVDSLDADGYRVVVAQDGEEGLQRADFVKPDLILLDVMMPGMDGFEVCRRLKLNTDTAEIPVIFMTSLNDVESKVKGFKVGGVDYVTKPIRIEELQARITTHISLKAMQRQLQAQNRQLKAYQDELEQRVIERTAELSASNRLLRLEIEQRKHTQERLALVDFALNQVDEAAYLLDEHGRFRYVNDEACRVLDYGRDELLTMAAADIDLGWPKASWPEIWAELKRLGSFIMETHHRRRDGHLFPVEINANFFEYQGVGYNLTLARDISERKRMEALLQASEREFRTLAENSPDTIVRYDCNYRRIYFNQAYAAAMGGDVGEILTKTPLEYWRLESPTAEEYVERLQQAMDSGETDEFQTEMIDKDGLPAYRAMFLVPEFDESNRPVSVLSISHDITGIKRMEAMLRKSEMEFRTLAENSPEMIVRYDLDCRRIYINPAYEYETGILLETVWNKSPTEICKPSMSGEEYSARLRRVMATGEGDRILCEWTAAGGQRVSHDLHAVAEYAEDGQVIGVLVIGHNVTELKNTERRLEESRCQLRSLTAKREEAREEERKRIAREIHDELGQLLNVMRLNATTLDFRFGDSNPDLRGKVQKMVTTVDSAIQMVRNLATRLRPAVLSSGVLPALDWLVNEYAESTGIACQLHVQAEEMTLDEDRSMLVFRIVQESLTNVLRHAAAKRVDIYIRSGEDVCEVEVRDNGKGFDPERAGRPNSYGIVGMRERALILKGTLDITAAEGGGTVLKLRIPIDG